MEFPSIRGIKQKLISLQQFNFMNSKMPEPGTHKPICI